MIDLIKIIYMNSKFHDTFTELVMKTLRDVYSIASNNLLCACNLYIHIWLNQLGIYIYIYGWMDAVLFFTIGLVD